MSGGMKISTYRAADMREVLRMVKEELGPDAVILSTKRVRETRGGLPLGRPLVEVTACPNPKTAARYAGVPVEPSRADARYDEVLRAPRTGLGDGRYEERGDGRNGYAPDPREGRSERYEPQPRNEAGRPERYEPRNEAPAPYAEGRYERQAPVDNRYEPRGETRYEPVRTEPVRPEPRPEYEGRAEPRIEPRTEPPRGGAVGGVPLAPRGGAPVGDELSSIRNTLVSLERQVSDLPSQVAEQVKLNPPQPGLDAESQRRYGWFIMHGVEEPIARQLAAAERAAKDGGLVLALQRFLSFRDPLSSQARAIALVGPTGVGKTTTLAKMAAELILNRRRTVGFITLDTFRVGAVAQLETYARLLQVRMVVARSASEVAAGMHSLAHCDHILVDTVGSSPYNRRQVNTSAELLPTLGEEREVLLCMAGNVRETEQRAIFRRFLPLQPTGLVFTKLDETVTYGGVLNVALRAKLPLTVYTDGQRVPENLGWMTPEVIAGWFKDDKETRQRVEEP